MLLISPHHTGTVINVLYLYFDDTIIEQTIDYYFAAFCAEAIDADATSRHRRCF
jgi:hypothetical protein